MTYQKPEFIQTWPVSLSKHHYWLTNFCQITAVGLNPAAGGLLQQCKGSKYKFYGVHVLALCFVMYLQQTSQAAAGCSSNRPDELHSDASAAEVVNVKSILDMFQPVKDTWSKQRLDEEAAQKAAESKAEVGGNLFALMEASRAAAGGGGGSGSSSCRQDVWGCCWQY